MGNFEFQLELITQRLISKILRQVKTLQIKMHWRQIGVFQTEFGIENQRAKKEFISFPYSHIFVFVRIDALVLVLNTTGPYVVHEPSNFQRVKEPHKQNSSR